MLIVAGALIYRAALGKVKIASTQLSKFNTLLEFSLLILVMAVGPMDRRRRVASLRIRHGARHDHRLDCAIRVAVES